METQVMLLKQRAELRANGSQFSVLFLFTILSLINFISASAFANPIVQYWENRMGSHQGLLLEPRISYYSTSHNYDANSQSTTFYAQDSVTRIYADLNFTYGFNENWFVFARLSALNSTVKSPSVADQTITGLGDQLLGTTYRLLNTPGGFSWNLQGEVSVPAYSDANQKVNHDPYLGDESTDLTIGTFFEIPVSTHDLFLELGAGYQYRSKGFSANVPWSVMFKRDPERSGFVFALGARGQVSLNTDTTPASVQQTDMILGAGGSDLIFALNPAWIVGQAKVGYKTTSGHTLYALAANPLSGTNAPNGIQISAGIQFDFGEKPVSAETKSASRTRSTRTVIRPNQFTSYDLDTKVVSISDQFYLAKIDKGMDDGVEQGQIFDIFNGESLVARAKVTYLKTNEAALNVVEYYQDQWIEPGFIARRVVR